MGECYPTRALCTGRGVLMTPRRALLTFALGCLAWLAFGFIALCAAKGLMPHLLAALACVFAYWKRTRRAYGYFD